MSIMPCHTKQNKTKKKSFERKKKMMWINKEWAEPNEKYKRFHTLVG